MFKTTDKINRALAQVMNAVNEIEGEERKAQALEVIHALSVLHSSCLSDLSPKNNVINNEHVGSNEGE